MKTVKFGVIGSGLMAKEFASASARWCHIMSSIPRPEIIALASPNPDHHIWFKENIPSIKHSFTDYKELLNLKEVEAVYIAVPHVLHEETYTAALRAGKHLMGEKPFGMDKAQNTAILSEIAARPRLFVRCASQFPYFPAMQLMISWIKEKHFGRIMEIRSGFCHASDLDTEKPANWKRQVKTNGEYGCMGDLGIHTQHVPFRMGFKPETVFAKLSKFITARPGENNRVVPCDTWDNAVLICDANDIEGNTFPMFMETKRMDPGSTNSWFFEIYGMKCSAKFSTQNPTVFSYTASWGKEQAWASLNVGFKPMIPVITGSIFEFGFTDAILQMWAAFMAEMDGQELPFGCFTPLETALSHKVFSAALESQKTGALVKLIN